MKQFNLEQIAVLVEGKLHGDGATSITQADIIRDAGPDSITFAESPEYFEQVKEGQASAVLISTDHLDEFQSISDLPAIGVSDVAVAFTKIVSLFRPPVVARQPEVSPQASIDASASIGADVYIGAGVVIGAGVQIGNRCIVHSGAHLMSGTQVGDDTEIYPHVVLYENTIVGQRCRLHANCVIGCYGFGYDSSTGEHILSTQLGNVSIGDDVDIGAGATIDRATYGSTVIGSGTKIDNQVQIGHNCKIGKRNLICSLVGIAGSCTTGDNVVMAGQVGIGDHINIGQKTILGAKAGVMADIPEGQVYVGIPATPAKQQMTIIAATHRLPEMRKKIKQLERELQKLTELTDCTDSDSKQDAA